MKEIYLDGKKVIDYEIEVESFIDFDDFVAYFCKASYEDGSTVSDDDLEKLNDKYAELIYEKAYDSAVIASDFLWER